jgi:hypothetical protein
MQTGISTKEISKYLLIEKNATYKSTKCIKDINTRQGDNRP